MSIYDNISRDTIIAMLEQVQGKTFNAEQKQLMRDFTKPTISFSDPGTGKTYTVVNGLIIAEIVDRIPAEQIVAVSFTRAASGELKDRHEKLCEKLGMGSKVKFKTFMGYCMEILKENASKMNWKEFKKPHNSMTAEEVVQYFRDTAEFYKVEVDDRKIVKIYNSIKSLNSSLVMDDDHVLNKMAFKQLGIELADFKFFRKAVYDLNRYSGAITVGDILLYTLELLLKNPDVVAQLKSEIKVLLVDEFQDMSVLQLLLCSLISDNMIAIGDINQQIYAFNGACGEIVKKYKEFYPEAKEIRLIQSYRCAQEIADFAYDIVKDNGMLDKPFKGIKTGGKVELHKGMDIEQLTEAKRQELEDHNNVFQTDEMFLCRNNYSIIPLADSLFEKKVPFRIIPKNQFDLGFPRADRMEVISDLCEVFELARTPYNIMALKVLKKFWPEFSAYYKVDSIPLVKIMETEDCSFLEACSKYQFKDARTAHKIVEILTKLDDMFVDKAPIGDMIDLIMPVMYDNYFKRRLIYMKEEPKYWLNLIGPLLHKSYQKFISDENEKEKWVKQWVDRNYGVKLFTIHGSKGLEADVVHIIDANEGVMPNERMLKKTLDARCYMDAADSVRNERSLAYVGVTRAKNEVHIYYDNKIAPIFGKVNRYEHIDKMYEANIDTYDDVNSFKEFIDEDIKVLASRI